MSPLDIQRAFEERNAAVGALRDLAEEASDREFTAEESEVYERQNTAVDDLDARIDTGLRSLQREAKAAEALENFRHYTDITTAPVENAVDPKIDDETLFRQLVTGEIRSFESLPTERRDQTKGTDSEGGYTVLRVPFPGHGLGRNHGGYIQKPDAKGPNRHVIRAHQLSRRGVKPVGEVSDRGIGWVHGRVDKYDVGVYRFR